MNDYTEKDEEEKLNQNTEMNSGMTASDPEAAPTPEAPQEPQSSYTFGGQSYTYSSQPYSQAGQLPPQEHRPYQQQPQQGYGYYNPYNPPYQRTPLQNHPNYSYTRPEKASKGIGVKGVIAIVLSCALIFSSIGFGSAWWISKQLQTQNQQTENQVPDQFAQRPDQNNQQLPELDQQNDSQSQSLADSADSARKADMNILTASAEEGALTTPEIVQKAQDSVVEIVTELVITGSYMQQYTTSGAGSGVIITEDGYILTNNHVIENATSITVTLHNGETYPATLLGLDEQLDVALLKIDAKGLTPATVASSSNLMVGQTVVAIGNPLGQLGGSVTQGIISALDRSITIGNTTMTLLQIDAAINPGNSGGGLFNAQGDLIGLVNAKSTGSDIDGIGFAIPIDNVMAVVDDLKTHGYVTGRVAIGVSLLDIDSDQKAWMYRVNELGCYVYRVTSDSPAAAGGLMSGDRIISVNGTAVSTSAEVKAAIQSVSVGDTLTFIVNRNGQELTLNIIAGEYVPEGISTSQTDTGSSSAGN